jgi:hypothetical protein
MTFTLPLDLPVHWKVYRAWRKDTQCRRRRGCGSS